MNTDAPDLFNNEEFKNQFNSLPEDQKKAYREAGEYMYSKDYTTDSNPQELIDNALDSIRRAFQCGLMPSDLSTEEVEFLVGIYGENWYETFGFSSSD
jgi:DNA-binding ferritin-like protein (Dps family)